MSLSAIMWIIVAISFVGVAVYAFLLGNKARLNLKEKAETLCKKVIEDYPEYLSQISYIEVREFAVNVFTKEDSGSESKVYNPADFNLSLPSDSDKSELANYLLDAMADGEWKKQMDRDLESKEENANLLGFTIINKTRIRSEHFKIA